MPVRSQTGRRAVIRPEDVAVETAARHPLRLKNKMGHVPKRVAVPSDGDPVFEPLIDDLRGVNFGAEAMGFHAAGSIDGISP